MHQHLTQYYNNMEIAAYNQPESVIDSHEDCAEFWRLSWLANHHEYDWPVCTVILTYLPTSNIITIKKFESERFYK